MAKKSKKEKATGRKKHRQLKRARKIQKNEKKKVGLPEKHRKRKKMVFSCVHFVEIPRAF